MEILLEEFYKSDIYLDRFHDRKIFLDDKSYQICGITQSGKTTLVKSYLNTLNKKSFLYMDCYDVRIEFDALNEVLNKFCIKNKIDCVVLDNYNPKINIPNVSQLIVISDKQYKLDFLETIWIYPLDYEEFLAFEHKFDSTALNHFIKLGGFACMHKILPDMRIPYIQQKLKLVLSEMEFDILQFYIL